MRSVEELLDIKNADANVLTCYNFVSQDVFTVDENEVVLCTAQDKLLVATPRCCIDVRDLDSNGQHLLTFPTASRVAMMDYCEGANFVVTLENERLPNAGKATRIRVYLNWWVSIENQTLEVRKIGNPPDVDSCTDRLQAVEFDTVTCATCVGCCSMSGAVAVAGGDTVKLFCPKTSEVQGRQYLDFEFVIDLKVHASPLRVFICEAHVAYYTNNELHVLKLCFEHDSQQAKEPAKQTSVPRQRQESMFDNAECSSVSNDPYFIEWNFSHEKLSSCKLCNFEDDLKDVVHPASFPVTLALRSECCQTTVGLAGQPERILLGPVRNSLDCKVTVSIASNIELPSTCSDVSVLTMVYRKFASSTEDSNAIVTFQWVPYYSKGDETGATDPLTAAMSLKGAEPSFLLHSPHHKSLQSLLCFVSSTEEGYLYDLGMSVSQLCVYKYSSQLESACLDECFLHAFTCAGLETYMLRIPDRITPPNLHCGERTSKSVRMVGLRPFLSIVTLVISESHLVLLSSNEDSSAESLEQVSSTLYSLLKPSMSQLYHDLKEAAATYKNEDRARYIEILEEAFTILSTGILLRGKASCSSELRKSYCDVCCLLGDLYLKDESARHRDEAAAYYIHSKQPAEAILARILSFKGQLSSQQLTKAIIAYLKMEMCRPSLEMGDRLDLASQSISSPVLEIVAEECPDLLHKLVLRCNMSIFRTEKALSILRRRLTNKRQSPVYAANTVAIAFLLLQTGNDEAAQNALKTLHKESLVVVMVEMHDLIHRKDNITPLGTLLKKARPDAYLSMLVHLKINGTMSAEQAVFVLQHSSPQKSLHCIPLLKEFLEVVLSSKRASMASHSHLLTMLIKIYIGRMQPNVSSPQLTQSNLHSKPASLFGGRAPWVKELPPFNGSSVTKSCSLYATLTNLSECCLCWNCWDDLLRLQSLLSSSLPSASVRASALDVLMSTTLVDSENYISLKVLSLPPGDAVPLLLERYPSAVLGYMQDKFADDTDQWLWLYKAVENKQGSPPDEGIAKAYRKIKHAALSYLANALSPERLVNLVPPGNQEYMEYVKRCTERYQAKLLQEKIITLGTELREMM